MTRHERLSRCYLHRETDRPAVYSRSGFPAGDPTYDRLKAYLAEHTELKAGWSGCQFESGQPWETHSEPHSADFERHVSTLHTPKGDLRQSRLESRKGQPGLHETFLIRSADDAEKYLSLPLPQIAGDPSSFLAVKAAVGDRGIAEVGLGMNPAGFVAELCGSETFALMSVTDRTILHALCERQLAIMLQRVRFLVAAGVGPFFTMLGEEYVVPPLHGPRDFDDFNVRYDTPILDAVHNAGGRVHVHCHGAMKRVLAGFVEMGVDVLHPFEPPPQGDILAREAKAVARGRTCLEGNIQIHRMYEASPEAIREETEQLIADAFDDRRGLIVCPTASPYIRGRGEECFPNYQAMIDAVLACAH
ncbi:MAG: Uroporphyrinogen decarboxylase (URO-D) [Lentisphaerae bacterium ADurb.BinA184]|nr:MAG: Uroporphyrinogen decarboxylase (URO-D) [Lentisphaerae bacterium ADurb.BinA184]